MSGRKTKKTDYPHTGVRWPFCPERFSAKTRGLLHITNLAGVAHYRHHCRGRHRWLAHMAKQGGVVMGAQR